MLHATPQFAIKFTRHATTMLCLGVFVGAFGSHTASAATGAPDAIDAPATAPAVAVDGGDGAPGVPRTLGNHATGARMAPGGGLADPVFLVQQARRLIGQLALAPDVQSQTDAILDKAENDAQAMLPDLQPLSRIQRAQKVRTFIQGVTQQLREILTPEQMQQLAQGMRTTLTTNGPAARIQKLKDTLANLGLDNQQKTQADAAIDEAVSQYKELLQERRQGQDVTSDMQEVGQDLREKLRSILTPEQMQTLRQAMQASRDASGATPSAETAPPAPSPDALPTTRPQG